MSIDLKAILSDMEAEKDAVGKRLKWRMAFWKVILNPKTKEEAAALDSTIGARLSAMGYAFEITDGTDVTGRKGLQFGFEKAVPDLWFWLCQHTPEAFSFEVCSTCAWKVTASDFNEALAEFNSSEVREPTYVETLNAKTLRGGSFVDPGPVPSLAWTSWRPVRRRRYSSGER